MAANPTRITLNAGEGSRFSEVAPLRVAAPTNTKSFASEFPPLTVKDELKGDITVDFEKRNLSIGTARYSGGRVISPNLTLRTGKKYSNEMECHSNVEVHIFGTDGKEVPMTRRLSRSWEVRALPDADVNNPGTWRIIGLEQGQFNPLSPFPLPDEKPNRYGFMRDHPSSGDAPGFQQVREGAGGQLQEFLAGNAAVGGVYYQILTLFDGLVCRSIDSVPEELGFERYGQILKLIDSGRFLKVFGSRLLVDRPLQQGGDGKTPLPQDFKFSR